MRRKPTESHLYGYIHNRPKTVKYKIVCPTDAKLDPIQMKDTIFDVKDLEMRQLYCNGKWYGRGIFPVNGL